MKFVLWKAPKGYEDALAPALVAGAAAHGDEIVIKPTEEYRGPEFDGGILIGVVKREILWDHQAKGSNAIYLDKGFHRSRAPYGDRSLPEWWRMCINAVHPTEYLMALKRPPDRAQMMPINQALARSRGDKIVILGSSAKFHHTHHLPHPTEWTQALVEQIVRHSDREIIYRPKPSWADAEPINGTIFDHGGKTPVADTLRQAHVAVTYGSIASVDAIIAGVPCIVLGNAVARPVAGLSVTRIDDPFWAAISAREQWFANLCYCHWRPTEIESGLAWATTKEMMRYAV